MDMIREIYLTLMRDRGWTMSQIDEMDVLFYFDLLAYNRRGGEQQQVQGQYIDDVF